MTTPPVARGVIVSLLTQVSSTDTSFRIVTFNTGNRWEYNSGRLTIVDLTNTAIAEFPNGSYSGVCYKDVV